MPCGPPKPLAEYSPGNGETRPQCHGAQRGFAETEAWPCTIYQVRTTVPAWCPSWNLSEHWLVDTASPKGHHTLKGHLHENRVYCPIGVGLTPSSCGGGKCRETPGHQLWGHPGADAQSTGPESQLCCPICCHLGRLWTTTPAPAPCHSISPSPAKLQFPHV